MGVVWKARSTALDVEVAVKLVRSSPNPSADAFKRMAREAHAAARLGHPAMATVLDFGATSSGDPYVVMELLHGESLGGGVLVDLAARDGARGLVLESTFSSLPDVAAHHYPLLPVRWLMRNRLDSLAKIGQYRGPLVQCHGDADKRIRLQDLVNMTDKKQIQEVVSTWPAYRGGHFVVRTMQWRLYDCFWQMRLPELQYTSDVSIALTTYLHYQGNGAVMNVPGFKR